MLTFITMQCDTIGDWQELIKFRSIADSTTKPRDQLQVLYMVYFWLDSHETKGQIISECLFDFLNFPKNHRKI